jgi:hypothetical protein
MTSDKLERSYCGCCGREMHPDYDWCLLCRPHVAHAGPAWERTWLAQHGTGCPFQVR